MPKTTKQTKKKEESKVLERGMQFINIVNLPDLARNYLFKIRFWSYETEDYDEGLELRARKMFDEYMLTFDEFQDFYVSKYFDKLKDNRFKLIVEFYNSQLTKVVYKKMIDCKLQIRPFVSLNQEDNVKLTRTAKIIKKGSFEYDSEED